MLPIAADRAYKPAGGGFGNARPAYETQPYVADPVGDGWEDFIAADMDTAADQRGIRYSRRALHWWLRMMARHCDGVQGRCRGEKWWTNWKRQ